MFPPQIKFVQNETFHYFLGFLNLLKRLFLMLYINNTIKHYHQCMCDITTYNKTNLLYSDSQSCIYLKWKIFILNWLKFISNINLILILNDNG